MYTHRIYTLYLIHIIMKKNENILKKKLKSTHGLSDLGLILLLDLLLRLVVRRVGRGLEEPGIGKGCLGLFVLRNNTFGVHLEKCEIN